MAAQLLRLSEENLTDDLYFEIISFLEISDVFNLLITSKKTRLCQAAFRDHNVWKSFYASTVERIVKLTKRYTQYLQVTNNYRQSILSLLNEINEHAEQNSKELTKKLLELPEAASMNFYPFINPEELLDLPPTVPQNISHSMNGGSISVAFLGPQNIGKTCLFITLHTQRFPEDYIPTVMDDHDEVIGYRGMNVTLYWRDTKDDDGFDNRFRPRQLAILSSDVIFICFDCSKPHTLIDETRKLVIECNHLRPGAPIVLVSTKIELRNDTSTLHSLRYNNTHPPCKPITKEQGLLMAKKMGCFSYIETSAKSGIGLKEIRVAIIEAYMSWLQRQEVMKKKKCQIQ
ncbi:hypothetical protein C9374_002035 [Naegleria lovaniensis]|uniref:Uncharacterized protein n=1 Tax=Naegleria lovaniensis TaxID=51637 RepID=A0AA88GU84_NAELO|nr:uncharacterized protein C9374_002035 [Naegleria lovaniensis]KAG2387000.1 hypothetical protein C9374_002035 [Naegleria lovaniensis]